MKVAPADPFIQQVGEENVSHQEEAVKRLQVVFDGRCGLCNSMVRWLLRRDRNRRIAFVAAGSERGDALLAKYGRDSAEAARTILVIREGGREHNTVLVRSAAILVLLKELPQPWPTAAQVLRWIPLPLRDAGYRIVARLRYRIWGRSDTCPIPTSGTPDQLR
jgi:predicted DCC family thiol-disulfide oxidoreductase YuxK